MEDKIDIHGREKEYRREMERLESDTSMDARDRQLILNFVWDCKMGKTMAGKCRKVVGKVRTLKYVQNLKFLSKWVGKPFDQVTQEDMERLVCGLEENIYKTREKNYTAETKRDYKKTLRKFYKWMGKPELVEFISLATIPRDVPALKREEAEAMINSTPDAGLKAAVMVLFDGGTRIEELLNLRMKDLTKEKSGSDSECFWIDVRYSKTFARRIPLPLCTIYLKEWLGNHPRKDDPEAILFNFSYPSFARRLKRLGRKAIKKAVYPHMLRHSSATYWAPKLNRYQLCAKYGWAFSSDMPDRYIKRKGIIFDEIAEKGDVDQTTKLQKENVQLKDNMERIEQEYRKVRKALEFLMPILESIDSEEIKRKVIERRRQEILREFKCDTAELRAQEGINQYHLTGS
jgi:site-specific recombinase XerD